MSRDDVGDGAALDLLGDPLEGLVMPPGSSGVLRSQATAFAKACSALHESCSIQQRAVQAVTGATWQGVGAQAAHGAVDRVVAAYQHGSGYGSHAASILNDGAGKWDTATTKYDHARALANQAQQEELLEAVARINSATGSPSDTRLTSERPPFSSLRAQAQRVAEEAIRDFNSVSSNLAHQLSSLGGDIMSAPAFITQPGRPWYDAAYHSALGGIESGIHWIGVGIAGLWNFVDNVHTAENFSEMVLGIALTASSSLGEGLGVGLDGTIVGAPLGALLNVAGAAGVASGVGLIGYAGSHLAEEVNNGMHQAADQSASGGVPASGQAAKAIPDAIRLDETEQETAARLKAQLGDRLTGLTEDPHIGGDYEGILDGKKVSFDAMGAPGASAHWDEKEFLDAIDDHLLKSNEYTVIDLTGFDSDQITIIEGYVDSLPAGAQLKIIRIGFR